jgi:hypothetical protein
MADSRKWTNIPNVDFSPPQVTERPSVLGAQKRPPNPSRFRFEQVNGVTWKLTNGELTEVPRSHGQWGGYRTTKAIAWVICVHPGQWLARCGDRACGPGPLSKAKANAMAMAKGAVGWFIIRNPVPELNGIQALLADRDALDWDDVEPRPERGELEG